MNTSRPIEGMYVMLPGRQPLHIFPYFLVRAAILRGNEWGKCTVRPILRARSEVRSMQLASTLLCRELVMTVNIPVQERMLLVGLLLVQGV